MTAKEMFEEMGYKFVPSQSGWEFATYEKPLLNGRDMASISFAQGRVKYTTRMLYPMNMRCKLLKAMLKQMEEFGWDE